MNLVIHIDRIGMADNRNQRKAGKHSCGSEHHQNRISIRGIRIIRIYYKIQVQQFLMVGDILFP